MTYRTLVSGSTTWKDEATMRLTLLRVWEILKPFRDSGQEVILVHPTIQGAAEMAARIWIELGGTVESHSLLPESNAYIRNAEMVDSGISLCIVFMTNKDMLSDRLAKLSERAGIHTMRITDESE